MPLPPLFSTMAASCGWLLRATVVCLLAVRSSPTSLGSSAYLPEWYHTTSEIYAHFKALAGRCELADVALEEYGTDPPIMLVKIAAKSATADAGAPASYVLKAGSNSTALTSSSGKDVAMILFGEHARELISPETAVRMSEDLCGLHAERRELAAKVLKHTEFHLVPVGNPKGRLMVEAGNFCQRENENSVDLNRNWDDHWQQGDDDFWGRADTAPGPEAFSEPETRSFRDVAVKYRPTTFITVHSGTLGMYTPYAYSTSIPERNEKKMEAALEVLDKKYCHCPYGAAGKRVGYLCPGTCLDWVYDKLKTPYSFAFEIYVNPEQGGDQVRAEYEEEEEERAAHPDEPHALLEVSTSSRGQLATRTAAHTASGAQHTHSCFIKGGHSHAAGLMPDECFAFFNPPSQQGYHETTSKWSRVFMELVDMMHGVGERPVLPPGHPDATAGHKSETRTGLRGRVAHPASLR